MHFLTAFGKKILALQSTSFHHLTTHLVNFTASWTRLHQVVLRIQEYRLNLSGDTPPPTLLLPTKVIYELGVDVSSPAGLALWRLVDDTRIPVFHPIGKLALAKTLMVAATSSEETWDQHATMNNFLKTSPTVRWLVERTHTADVQRMLHKLDIPQSRERPYQAYLLNTL